MHDKDENENNLYQQLSVIGIDPEGEDNNNKTIKINARASVISILNSIFL